jgi:hypothetical protein
MASSSSSPAIHLGEPPSEKLMRANYPLWRAQVLPAIRGAQLIGLLDGTDAAPAKTLLVAPADSDKDGTPKTVPNPEYGSWLSRDQTVLSYLLKSLSKEILTHVLRIEHTAAYGKRWMRSLPRKISPRSRIYGLPSQTRRDFSFRLPPCFYPRCKALQMNLLLLPALFQMMNSSRSSWPA